MRLDIHVSEQFHLTRNKAQNFIKDGLVSVNGKIILKPAFEIEGTERIELKESKKIHWVSRSAGKLDGFLDSIFRHPEWNEGSRNRTKQQDSHPQGVYWLSQAQNDETIVITWAKCLDVGSSTGGFTQVLLDRGAAHVDAVDVGTDQLHETIRNNPKVSSYEQTDIRDFQSTRSPYDIIVCDASFISLNEILPSILSFANHETVIILLWKPQFEVRKDELNKKTWVPKDTHFVVKKQVEWESFLIKNNCEVLQKEKSSVLGEAGNQEWLYHIMKKT